MQQKEEGKVQRHFGAAAKAIEAERAKAAAATAKPEASAPMAFRMVCSGSEHTMRNAIGADASGFAVAAAAFARSASMALAAAPKCRCTFPSSFCCIFFRKISLYFA